MEKVIVIMGSEKDLDFIEPAIDLLSDFEIHYEVRVASAHKTPRKLLRIIEDHESEDSLVYITVAGRSNALSGFVDANTSFPVIACPPYSNKFGGADIFSSLRMPSGVGPLVVLDPRNAAISALKILSLCNSDLSERIIDYQKKFREKVEESDQKISEQN